MKITKSELMHQKLQAAMREKSFPQDQLEYLGEEEGKHWYLVAGVHRVSADDIEEFEQQEDTE